jgi:hypothetical protein
VLYPAELRALLPQSGAPLAVPRRIGRLSYSLGRGLASRPRVIAAAASRPSLRGEGEALQDACRLVDCFVRGSPRRRVETLDRVTELSITIPAHHRTGRALKCRSIGKLRLMSAWLRATGSVFRRDHHRVGHPQRLDTNGAKPGRVQPAPAFVARELGSAFGLDQHIEACQQTVRPSAARFHK